jgi:hypothetical protein
LSAGQIRNSCLYKPFNEIYSISLDLIDEFNLEIGWLNDAIKVFMIKDQPKELLYKFPGLDVLTVTPKYLLAMKLLASRSGTNNIDDAKLLLKKLNIHSIDEARELIKPYLPEKEELIWLNDILENILD